MKKILTAILAATLVTTAFFGCDGKTPPATDGTTVTTAAVTEEPPYEPANGTELWDKINTVMEEVDSVYGESEITATCYANGLVFTLEGTVTEVYADDGFCMDSVMVMKNAEHGMEITMNSLEAYYDGKMYYLSEDGTTSQKLCTEMIFEDFLESQEDHTIDADDYSDCTNIDYTKGEDGGWTVKTSGYTGSFIRKLAEQTGLDNELLGADVDDVEITAVVDADFLVKTIDIKFIFDDSDPTVSPEFTMKMTYSDYGKTVMDPAKIKTEEYTLVDDIVVLDTIEEGITDLQNAISGNFEYNYKSTVNIFGSDDVTEEKDIVSYGRKNGAYFFELDSDYDGEELKLAYSGGVYSVTVGEETSTESCTDAEAKTIIDDLIDSAYYSKQSVTMVEKVSEGVYKLTVDKMSSAEYSAYLTEMGITSAEPSQTITVTLDGDNITKLETTIITSGVYNFEGQTADVKITEEVEITFKDTIEAAEAV